MRTTEQALEEAKEKLKKQKWDSESYHSYFDDLIEERLMELDPEYMIKMTEIYNESWEARWYA